MSDYFVRILDDIDCCMEKECFVAGLALALTVPDVCGKAEYPDKGNGQRYKLWFDEFIAKYEKPSTDVSDDMPYTNGELVYSLRNHVLHQGTPNVDKEKIDDERCQVDQFDLIIDSFMNGGGSMISYGMNMSVRSRQLEVNLVNLCRKISMVARTYYEENKEKFDFLNCDITDRRKNDDYYELDFDGLLGKKEV